MFDFEQAVSKWREQMSAGGIKLPEVLDELEGHLRDDVRARRKAGAGEQEAFETAAREMGRPAALRTEFANAGESLFEQFKRRIFALAGIHQHQLAMNTNTSSNFESGRSTYLKAAALAFPAAFLWLFSAVFLLPKANEICQRARMGTFSYPEAPAIFRAAYGVGGLMAALTHHGLFLAVALVLTLVLLEWRFKGWSRWRRATMGTGVVIFNAAVLMSMTLMIVSILVAATALEHGAGR